MSVLLLINKVYVYLQQWTIKTKPWKKNTDTKRVRSAENKLSELSSVDLTFRSVIQANTKLVRASPTDILAIHAGSIKPLIGCSPIAVADPTYKTININYVIKVQIQAFQKFHLSKIWSFKRIKCFLSCFKDINAFPIYSALRS